MAENVNITEGAGKSIGADDISGVSYQRIKLIHGADGTNDGDVSSANPLPVSVSRINNLIDGTLSLVTRLDRVHNVVDGTLATVARVTNLVDGSLSTVGRVTNLIDGTLTTVTNITNTVKVRIDPDHNVVNVSSTILIPKSISGTASGVSVSGNTIKSPVTSRVIKVYAFSIITTAQVHLAPRFTNGAGTSPTELWRIALQAPSQGIAGANLAVTPPGYLFATAAGETLSLVLDSASLVHYSVAYFLESA